MRKALSFLILLVALGLGQTAEQPPEPDFHLQDVNPRSNRGNAVVSPRDYIFQVSGYYFGAAH